MCSSDLEKRFWWFSAGGAWCVCVCVCVEELRGEGVEGIGKGLCGAIVFHTHSCCSGVHASHPCTDTCWAPHRSRVYRSWARTQLHQHTHANPYKHTHRVAHACHTNTHNEVSILQLPNLSALPTSLHVIRLLEMSYIRALLT